LSHCPEYEPTTECDRSIGRHPARRPRGLNECSSSLRDAVLSRRPSQVGPALSIPALALASGSRSAAFVCEGLLRAKVCSVPASSVGAAVRIQHARSFPVISHLIQDILNITSSNRAGAFTHRERLSARPLVSMSTGGRRGVTGGGRRENVSKRALARCL